MRIISISSLMLAMLATSAAAQYKVDTLCGAKVNLDKSGKLLARYQPDQPGAGYAQAVKLAVEFFKKCPNDARNRLPLYMTHCSIYRDRNSGFRGSDWPHNPAVVNAGMVQSLAIDWRNYSGDQSWVDLVRKVLDHHIQYGTTPESWEWASVPYASSNPGKAIYQGSARFDGTKAPDKMGRGDGSFALEVDKIGDMGMAYLRFYQITGESKYLQAAIRCADTLAKHVRKGHHSARGLDMKHLTLISPWPFRVRAEKGEILEDYTSHVIENLRLLDELIRIKDPIQLPVEKAGAYKKSSEMVWQWLLAADGPVKTSIWKGYYEDMPLDPLNLNRVNNSPMEFARYLIKNPGNDPNIETTVPSLIWWVKNTFGEPGMNAINEQTTCYKPMGSHTARYASICALWYERTGNEWFKEEAYRHFNYASYMTEPDGVVQVGHNWGSEIWVSDGYTDYIRHFMEGLGAVPQWAPAGENHLLRSSSVVQTITYSDKEIAFTTFDNGTRAVLRLISKPVSVRAKDKSLLLVNNEKEEGYTWKPLAEGGVLKVNNQSGNTVTVQLKKDF
ncbi:MAG: hypothetical protein WCJ35_00330 [Planctomycetota bacterium]